ncbi:hypothetical protein V1283_008049 [Bradyrhizobium sp. AZCC 2262]
MAASEQSLCRQGTHGKLCSNYSISAFWFRGQIILPSWWRVWRLSSITVGLIFKQSNQTRDSAFAVVVWIGADGSPVKYGGEVARKRRLLSHEGVSLRPPAPRGAAIPR